jgi:hypothetical protein
MMARHNESEPEKDARLEIVPGARHTGQEMGAVTIPESVAMSRGNQSQDTDADRSTDLEITYEGLWKVVVDKKV